MWRFRRGRGARCCVAILGWWLGRSLFRDRHRPSFGQSSPPHLSSSSRSHPILPHLCAGEAWRDAASAIAVRERARRARERLEGGRSVASLPPLAQTQRPLTINEPSGEDSVGPAGALSAARARASDRAQKGESDRAHTKPMRTRGQSAPRPSLLLMRLAAESCVANQSGREGHRYKACLANCDNQQLCQIVNVGWKQRRGEPRTRFWRRASAAAPAASSSLRPFLSLPSSCKSAHSLASTTRNDGPPPTPPQPPPPPRREEAEEAGARRSSGRSRRKSSSIASADTARARDGGRPRAGRAVRQGAERGEVTLDRSPMRAWRGVVHHHQTPLPPTRDDAAALTPSPPPKPNPQENRSPNG